MSNDEQVAVPRQLNLNGMAEGRLDLSWQDDLVPAKYNILVSKDVESDQKDQNSDHNKNDKFIQQDLNFILKHASEADNDFLLSLLHSQIDNPNRLETIMCDLLNIPNAAELIQDYRMQPVEGEGNPSLTNSNVELPESKKEGADTYLQRIRDMFPDADGLFLISECQQLKSWEDFSRFVNTVMISGVYPKKGAVEFSPEATLTKVVDITDGSDYRTTDNLSSDEEISSSGLIESPRKRRRRKKEDLNYDSLREGVVPDSQKWFASSEIDVIDLSSDTTEPFDAVDHETLQEMFNWREGNNEPMEVEEVPPPEQKVRVSNLVTDINNLLQTKFGTPNVVYEIPDTPTPGPSGSTTRTPSRMSLPGRATLFDDSIGEKSLAEIIEEKRSHRRASLASPVWLGGRSSTSKANNLGTKSLLKEALVQTESEVSSPEVSTSSQATQPESETDGGFEEGEDGPKVSEEWLAEQTANLIRIFPNNDPSYLREEVIKMDGSSDAINEFVIAKLERNDMPTRAEYEKKVEMEELQGRYTQNFSIEDFLKAVPDPWQYFTQGNRNCAKYKSHSLCYLKSAFRKHYVRDIIDTFNKNNCNLYLTYTSLKKVSKRRGSQRSEFECNHNRPTTIDIQFLQEVAFIENEEKIKDYLEGERIARQIKFDESKRTGSLLECQCCFDSEVLVEDIFYCPKDHAFCKSCIVRSVEVEMGYGRYKFECLANCEERFTLACLQNVLKPELFSKVIQAIQMEEIRAAGIEDLVQCPFCNYATIMPPEEKVMVCLNPECLKESCRLCKELNHIPLRCDEVEKSEEVKMRTYIENKMTEALVRTCHKCGKSFVKEDGCNKMTCTCGAKMCYVCRKPVTDYSHFNGQGGTETHKCPLYSTNDELHVELVKRVGEEAKAVIMQANPQTKLLHDPTVIPPKRIHQTPMPGTNNGAALDVAMRAVMGTPNREEDEHEDQHRHRERREIRREAEPYPNRHHRHRQRVQPESENEDEEVQYICNHTHNHRHRYRHHHHHHHHHHHRHRHVQDVNYYPV